MRTIQKIRCIPAAVSIGLLSIFALSPCANAASAPPQAVAGDRVVTNGASSYAIDGEGRLWAWGDNKVGELGNNSTVDSSVPTQVLFPSTSGHASIIHIDVSGSGSVYALDSDGHLWSWGSNAHGQLGCGDIIDRSTPSRVRFPAGSSGVSVVNVATTHIGYGISHGASSDSVYAIDNLGHLWSWGENYDGQLGNGQTGDLVGSSSSADRNFPVRVEFPASLGAAAITDVAVDSPTSGATSVYAVDSLGRLWSWGLGMNGQLGNGTTGDAPGSSFGSFSSPQQVHFPASAGNVMITSVLADGGGQYFFVLDKSGRLWTAGYNQNGAMGDGLTGDRQSIPIMVQFPVSWWQRSVSVVRVATTRNGYGASYAIDSAGHLWSWGSNRYGALGKDSSADQLTPQRVQLPSALDGDSIVDVKADGYSAYATDSDGRLWSWGNNRYGQLGNGSVVNGFSPPALVQFPAASGVKSIVGILPVNPNTDMASVYAMDVANRLWAWGYNKEGRLGNGASEIVSTPVQVRLQGSVPDHRQPDAAGDEHHVVTGSVDRPQFVYTADFSSISAYRVNTATGSLTEVPGSPFPNKNHPRYITANPSGTVAYVADSSSYVSVYRINATTGALTEIQGSPFKSVSIPYFIKINKSGTIAYVADRLSHSTTPYNIDQSTGSLTPMMDDDRVAAMAPNKNPIASLPWPDVTVSPTGVFAYWIVNDGIGVFRIDTVNGSNYEINSDRVNNDSVHSIDLNPSGTLAYITESPPGSHDSSIVAYHVNASTGALTPVAGNPVATGFGEIDRVAINPSGTLVFVAERGYKNGVWVYHINDATGALTKTPGSPFGAASQTTFITVVQP